MSIQLISISPLYDVGAKFRELLLEFEREAKCKCGLPWVLVTERSRTVKLRDRILWKTLLIEGGFSHRRGVTVCPRKLKVKAKFSLSELPLTVIRVPRKPSLPPPDQPPLREITERILKFINGLKLTCMCGEKWVNLIPEDRRAKYTNLLVVKKVRVRSLFAHPSKTYCTRKFKIDIEVKLSEIGVV